MTEEEWEAICDGCGQCCAFVGSNIACPSLDCATNRCMNYETRFVTESCCRKISPDNVIPLYKNGVLPASCAYVRAVYGKEPKPEPARLIPFMLAPLDMQKQYRKANEKWKKENEGCDIS